MTRLKVAAAAFAIMLSPLAAQAAEKTIVLNVDNATCVLCGPIVKRALSRVDGVKVVRIEEASVDAGAVATVTFDDAAADVSKLIAATTKVGYPSHPQNEAVSR